MPFWAPSLELGRKLGWGARGRGPGRCCPPQKLFPHHPPGLLGPGWPRGLEGVSHFSPHQLLLPRNPRDPRDPGGEGTAGNWEAWGHMGPSDAGPSYTPARLWVLDTDLCVLHQLHSCLRAQPMSRASLAWRAGGRPPSLPLPACSGPGYPSPQHWWHSRLQLHAPRSKNHSLICPSRPAVATASSVASSMAKSMSFAGSPTSARASARVPGSDSLAFSCSDPGWQGDACGVHGLEPP